MMLAAAAHAENKGNLPPPELQLAWQCSSWNCLPEIGGARDQPAGLLRKMTVALSVYNAFKTHERYIGNEGEMKQKNPEAYETWWNVQEMRRGRKQITDND